MPALYGSTIIGDRYLTKPALPIVKDDDEDGFRKVNQCTCNVGNYEDPHFFEWAIHFQTLPCIQGTFLSNFLGGNQPTFVKIL